MKPVGRWTSTRWTSPVTGFFKTLPRPSPTPAARKVLFLPLPSIVILAVTRPTTSAVGPRISHGMPPNFPVKIWPSASTCLSVVAGSTTVEADEGAAASILGVREASEVAAAAEVAVAEFVALPLELSAGGGGRLRHDLSLLEAT